jgi:hypothetical protein
MCETQRRKKSAMALARGAEFYVQKEHQEAQDNTFNEDEKDDPELKVALVTSMNER